MFVCTSIIPILPNYRLWGETKAILHTKFINIHKRVFNSHINRIGSNFIFTYLFSVKANVNCAAFHWQQWLNRIDSICKHFRHQKMILITKSVFLVKFASAVIWQASMLRILCLKCVCGSYWQLVLLIFWIFVCYFLFTAYTFHSSCWTHHRHRICTLCYASSYIKCVHWIIQTVRQNQL